MTTNNRIQNAGITLDDILQPYVAGDIVQTQTTNIQNGGQDIRLRYAGRDNKASNGYTGTMNLTSRIGNLTDVFNKSSFQDITYIKHQNVHIVQMPLVVRDIIEIIKLLNPVGTVND